MNKIYATVKCPVQAAPQMTEQLKTLGVGEIREERVSYDRFVKESRMNYDCVFQTAWEEKQEVSYLNFVFEDSALGREQYYYVEFHLKQIPLNLRYGFSTEPGKE